MDIIKELFSRFTQKDKNSIYLREIALIMEQMDVLKEKLEVKENLIKNYENELQRNSK